MTLALVKKISAIGIFISLFLPISQCSEESIQGLKSDVPEKQIENRIESEQNATSRPLIIARTLSWKEPSVLWVPLAFLFPLIFCFSFKQTKRRLVISQSLQSASIILLGYIVYNAVYIYYEPLFFGYVLSLLTLSYFLVTIVEWHYFFREN